MAGATYRVGVDIGGTFTDIVLIGSDGSVRTLKVLSSPPRFGDAVVSGMGRLLAESGLAAGAVTEFLHGTTVATNAILEGKGARTGLVTTEGFRDILELGRMRHPSLYDVHWRKPEPLVRRRFRFELDLRVGPDGQVERRPSAASVDAIAAQLREHKIESVAICLINSYANPEAESALAEQFRRALPGTYVTASVDVVAEMKEYERTSTAVVNASVQPIVDRYLEELQSSLDDLGISGRVQVMQSSGGLMDASAARTKPVLMIESGPAAGATAARHLSAQIGMPNVVALDMGGTTAKASLIENGRLFDSSEYEVGGGMNTRHSLTKGGGYAIRVPSIDIAEVGAGGGSICWVDSGGAPRVGPQSAGASPGPACYGRGGMAPTLTDAQVVLGYLSPKGLAGGNQSINPDLAARALQEQFAGPLGLELFEAAYGAYRIAIASMSKAVKAVTSQRGRDPRDFTLLAFGGAGPAYAAEMAREFDILTVVVPRSPGLFSAIGLLAAEIQHQDVFSVRKRDLDSDEIAPAYGRMTARLLARLSADGYDSTQLSVARSADLRYRGQAFELRIPVLETEVSEQGLPTSVRERFAAEHEHTYGHSGLGQRVELINLRVVAKYRASGPDRSDIVATRDVAAARKSSVRELYFGPSVGTIRTSVITRSALDKSPRSGPFVIEDMDATTIVPPGAHVRLDELGNLLIGVAVP